MQGKRVQMAQIKSLPLPTSVFNISHWYTASF